MTLAVELLLVALGLLTGSLVAFLFASYMKWVRRRHPGPLVRVWRALFVFPAFIVMVATVQAAGVSATSAADTERRGLVLLGYLVGLLGTPLVYWLRHRQRPRADHHHPNEPPRELASPTAEDVRRSEVALRRMKILAIALLIPITASLFVIAYNTANPVASTALLLAVIVVCVGIWQFRRRG